jgi:hypothetical protein
MDLSSAQWRKSSRTSQEGGQCVEVALINDDCDTAGSGLVER